MMIILEMNKSFFEGGRMSVFILGIIPDGPSKGPGL